MWRVALPLFSLPWVCPAHALITSNPSCVGPARAFCVVLFVPVCKLCVCVSDGRSAINKKQCFESHCNCPKLSKTTKHAQKKLSQAKPRILAIGFSVGVDALPDSQPTGKFIIGVVAFRFANGRVDDPAGAWYVDAIWKCARQDAHASLLLFE